MARAKALETAWTEGAKALVGIAADGIVKPMVGAVMGKPADDKPVAMIKSSQGSEPRDAWVTNTCGDRIDLKLGIASVRVAPEQTSTDKCMLQISYNQLASSEEGENKDGKTSTIRKTPSPYEDCGYFPDGCKNVAFGVDQVTDPKTGTGVMGSLSKIGTIDPNKAKAGEKTGDKVGGSGSTPISVEDRVAARAGGDGDTVDDQPYESGETNNNAAKRSGADLSPKDSDASGGDFFE